MTAEPSRRPLGRPRLRSMPGNGLPRSEIVAAAARLFAERGYANTTMSDIARAAGLQQSSLYYWFRSKELILQAAFAVNRTPLEFINRVGAQSGTPTLKLYRLLRFDTYQLCLAPCDVNEVERLAELQPDVFAEFWSDRQRLHEWVATLVRTGIEEGQLADGDAELISLGLLSFDEGIQKRYRNSCRHQTDSESAFRHQHYDARAIAEFSATAGLRLLMRRPADVTRIQRQAGAYDDI
jgi:AcrR family transcriptional regulator